MTKKFIYFSMVQLIIIGFMFIVYGNMKMVSYINMSFYVGGLITFFGLVTYVTSNGFFDIFTDSMRKVFTPKHMKNEANKMRLPSQVFSFSYKPIISLGLSILVCTCIALLFYYN